MRDRIHQADKIHSYRPSWRLSLSTTSLHALNPLFYFSLSSSYFPLTHDGAPEDLPLFRGKEGDRE